MVQMRKGKRYRLHAQTTWRQEAKEEETSQLDFNIGPRKRDDEAYICNDVRAWATNVGPPRIQDEKQTNRQFSERKEKEKVDRLETKAEIDFGEEDNGEWQ